MRVREVRMTVITVSTMKSILCLRKIQTRIFRCLYLLCYRIDIDGDVDVVRYRLMTFSIEDIWMERSLDLKERLEELIKRRLRPPHKRNAF